MNKITAFTLAAAMFNSFAFAANPLPGLYLGFTAGGTLLPSTDLTYPFENNSLYGIPASLSYSIGGNGGGQLGYRISNYRIEGEINYAYNSVDKLQVSFLEFRNKKVTNDLRLKGYTNFITGFINGYYDFYIPDSGMNFIPYVGLGLGYTKIGTNLSLEYNSATFVHASDSVSTGAVQGIIGFSYFADDYTSIALDFRYLTTNKLEFLNDRMTTSSVNLSLNFALAS